MSFGVSTPATGGPTTVDRNVQQNNANEEIKSVKKEEIKSVKKEGRTYSDISKKILKAVIGIIIGFLLVAATIALIVGLIAVFKPELLQIGVSKMVAGGQAIAAAFRKGATWIAANPIPVTVAGAVGVGVGITGAIVLGTAEKCCKKKDKTDEADADNCDVENQENKQTEDNEGEPTNPPSQGSTTSSTNEGLQATGTGE
jgi:hypothetical protein